MQPSDVPQTPLYVYIVLSKTHTTVGKLIRKTTRSVFSHSSISLTEDLTQMYSFARYRLQNPWRAGFVKENIAHLTLNQEQETYVEIYRIAVSPQQYHIVEQYIRRMREDEEEYIYNTFGPLFALFNTRLEAYKAEICSQFVACCLAQGGVLPEALAKKKWVFPQDFAQCYASDLFYRGALEAYVPACAAQMENDAYFERYNWFCKAGETCKSFAVLIKRIAMAYK